MGDRWPARLAQFRPADAVRYGFEAALVLAELRLCPSNPLTPGEWPRRFPWWDDARTFELLETLVAMGAAVRVQGRLAWTLRAGGTQP